MPAQEDFVKQATTYKETLSQNINTLANSLEGGGSLAIYKNIKKITAIPTEEQLCTVVSSNVNIDHILNDLKKLVHYRKILTLVTSYLDHPETIKALFDKIQALIECKSPISEELRKFLRVNREIAKSYINNLDGLLNSSAAPTSDNPAEKKRHCCLTM